MLLEKIVLTVADANIGSIFSQGFAPFKGGTLRYIKAHGVENVVRRTKELAEWYGRYFSPPEILVRTAQEGKCFE